nr:TetR family transcriptional regulator [Anaerolineae bacterium]
MAKATRDSIVEAAIALFNQNGYHATSMRDIAREVDIKKPSLYHHFESKEAILLAILETGMTSLIKDVQAIAESDQDCLTKLQQAITRHATLIAENLQGAAVFLREDRGLGEEYLHKYVALRDEFELLFRRIVDECVACGYFRKGDLSISVHALFGMVNWMTRWYRPEGRLSAAEIAEIFFDLFVLGMLKRPSPDKKG